MQHRLAGSASLLSFEISNGIEVLTLADFDNFQPGNDFELTVWTDGSGNITLWNFTVTQIFKPFAENQIIEPSSPDEKFDRIFGTASASPGRGQDFASYKVSALNGVVTSTANTPIGPVGSWSMIPSAVPEPGTWMMLVLGFGLIGAAMRASKRKPRVNVSYA